MQKLSLHTDNKCLINMNAEEENKVLKDFYKKKNQVFRTLQFLLKPERPKVYFSAGP